MLRNLRPSALSMASNHCRTCNLSRGSLGGNGVGAEVGENNSVPDVYFIEVFDLWIVFREYLDDATVRKAIDLTREY